MSQSERGAPSSSLLHGLLQVTAHLGPSLCTGTTCPNMHTGSDKVPVSDMTQ